MKAKFNWSNVNWLDQDIVIAKTLGCTKEAVRQKRNKLGKEQSPNYCKHNVELINKLLQLETKDKTLNELSSLIGYNAVTVRNILDKNNKKYIFVDRRKIGKYDWSKADWAKTDREVANILGVTNRAVVTGHRRRLGIIKNRIKIIAKKEYNPTSTVGSTFENIPVLKNS
jgi:lambda repressor-like predicted transcriptional regulator